MIGDDPTEAFPFQVGFPHYVAVGTDSRFTYWVFVAASIVLRVV